MGKLTDSQCRAAKATEKIYRLPDGHGLSLEIRPSGSKAWLLYFRPQNGKPSYRTLGQYPGLTLTAARNAAMEMRVGVRGGNDPRGPQAAPDGSDTFATVAQQWYEANREAWTGDHAARVWNRLEADAFPTLGGRGIKTITSPEVLAVLRKVEARGAVDVTKRLRQAIQAIYTYAIASGLADGNPALGLNAALKRKPAPKHHAHLEPTAENLAQFFKYFHKNKGDEKAELAMLLLMHVGGRSKEFKDGTWDEIKGDRWIIPASRMNMRRDHIIPISPQTKAILGRLREIAKTERRAKGDNRIVRLTYNQMHSRLKKIWEASRGEIKVVAPNDPRPDRNPTIHGMRSVFKTIAEDSGLWSDRATELALAHVDSNTVRAAYNRSVKLDERTRLAHWWGDYLDQCEAKGRDLLKLDLSELVKD